MQSNGDDLLLVVDTGFNGDLMVTRRAASVLGVDAQSDEADVELGDGTTARLLEGATTIDWLDEKRRVRVFIADAWATVADGPDGLLGTNLLSPHLLLIDFAARTVEIETVD